MLLITINIRITHLSCNPSESAFVSSASNVLYGAQNASAGSLTSWNLKTMQVQQTFVLEGEEASSFVNSVQFNHNGQLFVTGNDHGLIKIFGKHCSNDKVG
jgi:WD40 repeat protein